MPDEEERFHRVQIVVDERETVVLAPVVDPVVLVPLTMVHIPMERVDTTPPPTNASTRRLATQPAHACDASACFFVL